MANWGLFQRVQGIGGDVIKYLFTITGGSWLWCRLGRCPALWDCAKRNPAWGIVCIYSAAARGHCPKCLTQGAEEREPYCMLHVNHSFVLRQFSQLFRCFCRPQPNCWC
ncbi:unnamed protein product [Discosporangium mesarthrocarpum]